MREAKNTHYIVSLFILVSVLLILLDTNKKFSSLHKGVQNLTLPVERQLFNAREKILSPFGLFTSKDSLIEQIKQLEKENIILSAKVGEIGRLQEENQAARRLLSANPPAAWHFAPARVISRSAGKIYLVSDFVPTPGTVVVTSDEAMVFLGQVERVVGKKIEAILPHNSSSKIPTIVRSPEGSRQASGILIGQGDRVILDQVISSEILVAGDFVITSGEDFPEDLLIGEITQILPVREGTWKQAEVESVANPKAQDVVFFVTKY